MREHQQQIGREGQNGGRCVERKREAKESGGPEGFPASPRVAGKQPRDHATGETVKRAEKTKNEPNPRTPEQVNQRNQRRLIEPDALVQRFAEQHLSGCGERQGLFRPQNMSMAEMRSEERHK